MYVYCIFVNGACILILVYRVPGNIYIYIMPVVLSNNYGEMVKKKILKKIN